LRPSDSRSGANAPLMRGRNLHVFPVFGDGAPGDLDARRLQAGSDLLVGQRMRRVLASIIFFTMRLTISSGVAAPTGPCTASEKK